jgi:hypothetical protein
VPSRLHAQAPGAAALSSVQRVPSEPGRPLAAPVGRGGLISLPAAAYYSTDNQQRHTIVTGGNTNPGPLHVTVDG